MALLEPFENVTVLYGHIHRKDERTVGRARHLAARSLVFAFPDPAAGAERKPIAFDSARPFANLGIREVSRSGGRGLEVNDVELRVAEFAGTAGIQRIVKGGLVG